MEYYIPAIKYIVLGGKGKMGGREGGRCSARNYVMYPVFSVGGKLS